MPVSSSQSVPSVTLVLPAKPRASLPAHGAKAASAAPVARRGPEPAFGTEALREAPLLPRPAAPAPAQPAVRSRAELDDLIALTNRALELSETAQGLQDLVGGMLVGGFALVHLGVVVAKTYLWTWMTAAEDGAIRGRARVCRPSSTSSLRHYEFVSGTLVGAGVALAMCPVTAILVASRQGIETLQSDFTYVATRVPRGLYTYLQINTRPRSVDDLQVALRLERDALILERAQPEQTAPPVLEEE